MAAAPSATAPIGDIEKHMVQVVFDKDGKAIPTHEFKYEPPPVDGNPKDEDVVISSGSETQTVTKEMYHPINIKASSSYHNWFETLDPKNLCIKWDTKERPPIAMAPNMDELEKRKSDIAKFEEKKARYIEKVTRDKAKRAKDDKEQTDDEFSEEEFDEVDDADLKYKAPTFDEKGKEHLDPKKDSDGFAKTGFRVNGVFKEATLFVAPFLPTRKVNACIGVYDSIKKNRNSKFAAKDFDDGKHQILNNITGIPPSGKVTKKHETSDGWDPTAVVFDKWMMKCNVVGAKWIRKTGMRPLLFIKIAQEVRLKELEARVAQIATEKSDLVKKLSLKEISQGKYDKRLRYLARKEAAKKRVDPDAVHALFAKRYLGGAVITSAEGRLSGDAADKMIIFEANNTIQWTKEEFLALTPETMPKKPEETTNAIDFINSTLFYRRVHGQLPYKLFLPNIIKAKTGMVIDPKVDPVGWLNVTVGQNDIVAPVGFFDYNFNSDTCRVRFAFTEMIWHSKGISTFGKRRFRDRSSEVNVVAFDDADDLPDFLPAPPVDMITARAICQEINESDIKKSKQAAQRGQKDTSSDIRNELKRKWEEAAKTKLIKGPTPDELAAAEEAKKAADELAAKKKSETLALAAKKKAEFKEKMAAKAAELAETATKVVAVEPTATIADPPSPPPANKRKSPEKEVPSTPPPKSRVDVPVPAPPQKKARSRSRSRSPVRPRALSRSPVPERKVVANDDGDDDDDKPLPPPPPPPPPAAKPKKSNPKIIPEAAKAKAKRRAAVIPDDDD